MHGVETFSTQSIYQAAFCLCQGLELQGLVRGGSKVTFVFAGRSAKKKALDFYNRANVEAKQYSECFRSLKDMIFQR